MKLFAAVLTIVTLLMGCSNSQDSYNSINAEEVKTWQTDGEDFVLLDVRTMEEYSDKHIVGATLLPLNELESKASSVLTDLEQPIVIYCRSGNRSAQAAKTLTELGYTNVYDLGGINSWPYETE